MTHDVIRHLLDDYVTGDLPEDARAPVADHVATCAACSAEVDSLRRILARASELPAFCWYSPNPGPRERRCSKINAYDGMAIA